MRPQESDDTGLAEAVAQAIAPAICLDAMPKSTLRVHAVVIQAGAAVACAAIIAAAAAATVARLPMRDIVVAAQAGDQATAQVAVLPHTGAITWVSHTGAASANAAAEAQAAAMESAQQLAQLVKAALLAVA